MKKIIIVSTAIIIMIVLIFSIYKCKSNNQKFVTEKVTSGDIKSIVNATGVVDAVTMIQVGTQVSGTIKQLFVDFNSSVKKGQLLAQIDPAIFEAQVQQAQANLSSAKANLEKSEVAVRDTKISWERNKTLYAKNFISKSELDTSETNYLSSQAQVKASQALVEQAQAALNYARINLKYTKILSPVKGIVIARSVDVGQTVAASFQTPTLFAIAQDLTKMQINTSVDEADIGKIKELQPVNFSVDAYPDINFAGKVSEIRNAPITVQNVVTYAVVIKVDNPDKKLKPGMTANVSIVVADKKNVLRIPNAALRFKLPENNSTVISRQKGPSVWILENKKLKQIILSTGISDGTHTELLSGEIKEGQPVIVDVITSKKNSPAPSAGAPRFIR